MYIIENHSATTQHHGHTFSPRFLREGWSGVYNRLKSAIPPAPVLILDPWGKWNDAGKLATLVDQFDRCRMWLPPDGWTFTSGDPRIACDLASFNLLTRLTQPLVFKLGWIPTDFDPQRLYQALYPIISTWSRFPQGRKPYLCFDALFANQDHAAWVVPTCCQWGFSVMGEGWPVGKLSCSSTLCSWQEFQANGGFANLRLGCTLIVPYAPEHGMTRLDALNLERLGHTIAYTHDTFPGDSK